MCTVPQCLSGLLTAALGRKHFTEELKLQRDTAGQWGVRAAVPPPPHPGPALHCTCSPSRSHTTHEVTGFQSLFWVLRSRPGGVALGPLALGAAFSLGKPPGESQAATRLLRGRAQFRKNFLF